MDTAFAGFLQRKADYFQKLILRTLACFWKSENLKRQTGMPQLKEISSCLKPALSAPAGYIFEAESKKLRPVLGYLMTTAMNNNPPRGFEKYLVLPELLHSASLAIDDIEDGAILRRNRPCLHIKYGTDTAVNIANAVYFLPFYYLNNSTLGREDKLAVCRILTRAMNRIHLGQGLDVFWHKNPLSAINPRQYLAMVKLKTSSFFRAEAELAVLFSGAPKAAARKAVIFAENIGAAFQIIDDVLDLTVTRKETGKFGKKFAQDIAEGKKTLIVSYALKKASLKDRKKLLKILGLRRQDIALARQAIAILQKYNSIRDAENYAYRLVRESWDDFSGALLPSRAKDYLGLYCRFILERRF